MQPLPLPPPPAYTRAHAPSASTWHPTCSLSAHVIALLWFPGNKQKAHACRHHDKKQQRRTSSSIQLLQHLPYYYNGNRGAGGGAGVQRGVLCTARCFRLLVRGTSQNFFPKAPCALQDKRISVGRHAPSSLPGNPQNHMGDFDVHKEMCAQVTKRDDMIGARNLGRKWASFLFLRNC